MCSSDLGRCKYFPADHCCDVMRSALPRALRRTIYSASIEADPISAQATAFNVVPRCSLADWFFIQLKQTRRGAPPLRVLAGMSALGVFVLQCGDIDLYALTLYRSGDNLPEHVCADGWRYRGKLQLNEQSLSTLPIDVDAVIDELKREGIFFARLSSGLILLLPQ